MRVLLDTHVFLWAILDSKRLDRKSRSLIASADAVYVSAASVWEIAIKSRLGKIDGDPSACVGAIPASGFMELPVSAVHAAAVAQLEMHHADPFDRLLVAQAITEPLRLLTADPMLVPYSDVVQLIGS
jgi:PIN domain nuclease of toxin-antitoxin system